MAVETEGNDPPTADLDNETLENLAVQELLQEAKRGKERAKDVGSLGWQKSNVPPANKRFLNNMLVSTLCHAHHQDSKYESAQRRRRSSHQKDRNSHRKRQNVEETEVDYGDFDAYKYTNSVHNDHYSRNHHRTSVETSKQVVRTSSATDDNIHNREYSSRKKRRKHDHSQKRLSSHSHCYKSKQSHKSKNKPSSLSKSKHKHKKKHKHKERVEKEK